MAKQVAVIGGVSGSIGSALARKLAQVGWSVHGFGRDAKRLDEVREAIPEGRFECVEATDAEAVGAFLGRVAEEHGAPTGYVHAVGSVFLKAAHQTKIEEWEQVLRTNLDSAFFALRVIVGQMRKERAGSIVLISSVAAQTGLANHEAIAAAKGGVAGLARAAAATYASMGIRVNALAPGLVASHATQAMVHSDQARQISERMHPLGRLGEPEDVAALAAWLLSKEASWVTGQVWGIDGGMGAIVPKPRV